MVCVCACVPPQWTCVHKGLWPLDGRDWSEREALLAQLEEIKQVLTTTLHSAAAADESDRDETETVGSFLALAAPSRWRAASSSPW